MGCDIHTLAQRKRADGSYEDLSFQPFNWRWYGMFGFLADVRNYSFVPPVAPRRGVPPDMPPDDDLDYHSHSWLIVKELADFDYDATFEDRRTMAKIGPNSWNGAADAGMGNGKITTFREFLGEQFFQDIAHLQQLGADRIVFWFDN